ncbi:sterol desaturase family protein [Iamia sp. SCSIO 61187]|uniref:sterol desaturase family protein n=1 Tax=Iamia sp. SCSIO 61187 TaxID=2722752 RepID=UPI001C635B24|nr:sterol desaturase family protein [Iamia sp. SCSIO 61187]QYG91427.1 sterol desaturase family protein [Iamia sp. SCSIO 61187]
MTTAVTVALAVPAGWAVWTLAEYLLHRFAMHHLHGRGIMSREHLEHHVTSGWSFDRNHVLSWTGMLLVGGVVWAPLGWVLVSPLAGVTVAAGWAFGYFFYEYQHAVAHLRAPRTRYQRLVRRHHFHHHFGAPMRNHGVTIPFWDHVFGTHEAPDRVRVPRRLALPWLVDADGEVRPAFAADYVLVGAAEPTERLLTLDRARAFASVAPAD